MIFLHLLTVQNGGIKRSSLEVLSRGRELVNSMGENGGANGTELHAVVCSPEVAGWDEAKWNVKLAPMA